ncbi:methionine--tRNA ligase [Alphaproteobacteria bacterium]|nr:methionine--tRNA ligase [Alphaproteobacteria bacterium]
MTPYYLTTPIYYVNDKPHIGHAYTSLACDVLARFKRLDGFLVKFLTGTDEHGQKVEKSAEAAGIDPQTFTDRVSQHFRHLAETMSYTNDDFIRTTEPRHIRTCQALWNKLLENGHIYLGGYAGWYSVRDEAFYGETEIEDSPGGGKIATASGAPVEWLTEPSYFFRLSQWGEKLLAFYESHPDFIAPTSRRNEVVSFVKSGLQDLSISRTSFKWGVPVPGDKDHIMYVWIDALVNYITAAGYPDDADSFARYWPADLHMVGKDIIRFHAVYWPAFLMAAGLPPPKRVYAHGWWTNEGQKISKSLGNIIDPLVLTERYGLDQVRYFLMREMPFGNDGDFSHKAIVNRTNGELANDLGNLIQRSLSMISKNCGQKTPAPGAFSDEDKVLLDRAAHLLEKLRVIYDRQQFHEGLECVWEVVRAANVYVDRQAPWALRKTDLARMGTVLYVLAEVIRHIGLLLQPVMPESCSRILDLLSVAPENRIFASLKIPLEPGVDLPKPVGIFPRYAEENVEEGEKG